jgi:NAD-dependent dihydropyrimidine dehydrogenase PreA subunit
MMKESTMQVKRKIVEINEELCNGCGLCAEACSEGAIRIVDGKAKLVAEKYCDGLGMCIGECPEGAITIIEKDADEFDPEAVEAYLKTQEPAMECGCPSSYVRELKQETPCQKANQPVHQKSGTSALTHWPVQIRLIPATAPFLKNARLLVAADCTCVALPNLHDDYLNERVVMIGCPKFDDPEPYIQKFADIFKNNPIKEITVLVMEVPCCSGLPMLVKKGMDIAGKAISIRKIVINTKGQIIQKGTFGGKQP